MDDEHNEDNASPSKSVDFLYQAMLTRDPKKRRVKPVQSHMLQLDFAGLDDSEDDSDFELKPSKESDHEDGHSDSSSKSGSESDSEQSDADSDEESEAKADHADSVSEPDTGSVHHTEDSLSLGDMPSLTKGSEDGSGTYLASKKMKVLICSVCLGDKSEEEDEIVECDGCGVSVHEGCYGVGESQSTASTESSASTEPWFCDACKAGIKPHCELCPNFGGIYKETDAGRWVHLVCALYTPGVAFGDVDKLNAVTLFEMPYNRWGARQCCLCEDPRFCWTGVCIGCDAGLCRSYFHVTCAQKEGLLSEASPDENIADPFFAYCKQHADKNMARCKRRNWLAVQSQTRSRQQDHLDDQKERFRVQRKLLRHKQKYNHVKENRPPCWAPPEKVPRMLTSSASAVRRLLRKAELLGIATQTQSNTKDGRKRQHVAAAFSVEFISYYIERNNRVTRLKEHITELSSQSEKLQTQEAKLRAKYDKLHNEVNKLKKTNGKLRSEAEDLWACINAAAEKPFPLPEVVQPPEPPVTTNKAEPTRSPPHVIHQCSLCKGTGDQHLLAHCDSCKLYYHLGCLDPPLTRMPKQTKLQGWQCSECVSSSSEESDDPDVDPDAPRKLREKFMLKGPVIFSPVIKQKKKVPKRGRKKKKILEKKTEGEDGEAPKPSVKKRAHQTKAATSMRPKYEGLLSECCVCLKDGDNTNLIRCDECLLCYHFQCLDPPLKKSPKQRGYAWHCTACDPTDSSDDYECAESPEEEDQAPGPSAVTVKEEPPAVAVVKREFKRKSTSPFQRNYIHTGFMKEASSSPEKEMSPVRESKRVSTSPFSKKRKPCAPDQDFIYTVQETKSVLKSKKTKAVNKKDDTAETSAKKKKATAKKQEIVKSEPTDKDKALDAEDEKEQLPVRESQRASTSPFSKKKVVSPESENQSNTKLKVTKKSSPTEKVTKKKQTPEKSLQGESSPKKKVKKTVVATSTCDPSQPIQTAVSRKKKKKSVSSDETSPPKQTSGNITGKGSTDTEGKTKAKASPSSCAITGKASTETETKTKTKISPGKKKTQVPSGRDDVILTGNISPKKVKQESTSVSLPIPTTSKKEGSPPKVVKRKSPSASLVHPKKAKLLAHQTLQNESSSDVSKSPAVKPTESAAIKAEKIQERDHVKSDTAAQKISKPEEKSLFGKGSKLEKIAQQLSAQGVSSVKSKTREASSTQSSSKNPKVSQISEQEPLLKPGTEAAKHQQNQPEEKARQPPIAHSSSSQQSSAGDKRASEAQVPNHPPMGGGQPTGAMDLSMGEPTSLVGRIRERYCPQFEDISDAESTNSPHR